MDRLSVKGNEIIKTNGETIKLRGLCIGGWMNMEHFLNGFPGSEARLRYLFKEKLGTQLGNQFFELWLNELFNEEDVRFIKDSGFNVIRIPLNYRHFESDLNPFVYLDQGFERLDAIIRACEQAGLYVILDMHSVQGWQNGDWHADNSSRHALFWVDKTAQDRFYALWEEIARRYKDQPTVAGYNLINEPISNAPYGRFGSVLQYTPNWDLINQIYKTSVNRIRAIDPFHIIFLEGDYFSTLFDGLDAPFAENLVYSSHNYVPAMTSGKPYPGHIDDCYWDKNKIRTQFLESAGYQFSQKYQVPLWVGEFGGGVDYPSPNMAWQFAALNDQLSVYAEFGIHWTFWAYKDIGAMSVVQTKPNSHFNQIIRPVLDAKNQLCPDFGWLSGFPEPINQALETIENNIIEWIPDLDKDANRMFFRQAAMSTYTADLLQELFVNQFTSYTPEQWKEIFESFSIKNCIIRKEELEIFSKWF